MKKKYLSLEPSQKRSFAESVVLLKHPGVYKVLVGQKPAGELAFRRIYTPEEAAAFASLIQGELDQNPSELQIMGIGSGGRTNAAAPRTFSLLDAGMPRGTVARAKTRPMLPDRPGRLKQCPPLDFIPGFCLIL